MSVKKENPIFFKNPDVFEREEREMEINEVVFMDHLMVLLILFYILFPFIFFSSMSKSKPLSLKGVQHLKLLTCYKGDKKIGQCFRYYRVCLYFSFNTNVSKAH